MEVGSHHGGHLAGKHARTLAAHEDCITDFAVSTSGSFAVTVSADHQLILWNWHLGGVVGRFTADCELACCALTPDGLTVIAGDHEGHVHLLRVEGAWADAQRLRQKADNGSITSHLTELLELRASINLIRRPLDRAWAGKAYLEACIECVKQSETTFPSECHDVLLGALEVCGVMTNGGEHVAWLGKYDVVCTLFELVRSVAKATKLDAGNCAEEVLRRLDIATSAIESAIAHCPNDWFGDYAGSTLSRLVDGEAALAIAYSRATNANMASGYADRASEHFHELLDADGEESIASYTRQLHDTCAAIAESGAATYFDDQNAGLSRIVEALNFLCQVRIRSKNVELPLDAVSDAASIVVNRFIAAGDVQGVRAFVSGLARVCQEPLIGWDDHWRSHQTWLFAKLARRLNEQGEIQQRDQVLTEMEALVREIEDDRASDDIRALLQKC